MRVLLQRVSRGSVTVDRATIGEIEAGYVLLTGITEGDSEALVVKMAAKVAALRLFPNEEGKFDRSLRDVGGGALVISQFTLYGEMRKGRRPSFSRAAAPALAEPLVARFAQALREAGVERVETGEFGASMQVDLCNDGPVTLMLDSAELFG